jgi:stage III sporulation protein AA
MTDGRYDSAAMLLPERLRRTALKLGFEVKTRAEEFRLRSGRPFSVVLSEGEKTLSEGGEPGASSPIQVSNEDILTTLETASMGSAHTSLESMRAGYVTVSEGHRIGICGQAVVKEGELYNIRQPSSLNIRIARERKGIAEPLIESVMAGGVAFQKYPDPFSARVRKDDAAARFGVEDCPTAAGIRRAFE